MRNSHSAGRSTHKWSKKRTISTENIVTDTDKMAVSDASRVVCLGAGLTFGYLNHPILSDIDTRNAGPGELTVFCEGRDGQRNAFCELIDHGDATFTMTVKAQDAGLHKLHVQYDEVDVPGSPFALRVSPASLVKISGPGLRDGILNDFRGEFHIQSDEAGSGEIKLRVGGPKGAFKVLTEKTGRTLVCQYNPREAGFYVVHALWSGDHLLGSPFRVFVADSHEQLTGYRQQQVSTA